MKRAAHIVAKALTGSYILYRTDWYRSLFLDAGHETYPDNTWYRTHSERNFDVVNLGSSAAKYAFDYGEAGVRGMNWAQAPQTLRQDYNLLRHFHSILRQGAYVLITIMPFTSLNKATNIYDALRYAKFDLQGEPIEPHLFGKARRAAAIPLTLGVPALKALARVATRTKRATAAEEAAALGHNPMSREELERDARRWVGGWKRQFGIADLSAPLTEANAAGRKVRTGLMRELVDFCAERGYKPAYVIPPVTRHMQRLLAGTFEQTYVYGFLAEVGRDVPTIDLSKDEALQDDDLFFNSFFLNARGRCLFTAAVLARLGLGRTPAINTHKKNEHQPTPCT